MSPEPRHTRTYALITGLSLAATPAAAGGMACRFEHGVIVVPAAVDAIAGDFILDTGSARTALHETRAGAEGLEGAEFTGVVRVAGVTSAPLAVAISDLDPVTYALPTAVIGVLGADVLKAWVVDIQFTPCRVSLWAPAKAPPFVGRPLPLAWDAGRPAVAAEADDGVHALRGPFVLATGSEAPVRLADDAAELTPAPPPAMVRPGGPWLARLPQLRFAGETGIDVAAGLTPAEGDALGTIGGPVLARWRIRFDFPGGQVVLAPPASAAATKKGPGSLQGP